MIKPANMSKRPAPKPLVAKEVDDGVLEVYNAYKWKDYLKGAGFNFDGTKKCWRKQHPSEEECDMIRRLDQGVDTSEAPNMRTALSAAFRRRIMEGFTQEGAARIEEQRRRELRSHTMIRMSGVGYPDAFARLECRKARENGESHVVVVPGMGHHSDETAEVHLVPMVDRALCCPACDQRGTPLEAFAEEYVDAFGVDARDVGEERFVSRVRYSAGWPAHLRVEARCDLNLRLRSDHSVHPMDMCLPWLHRAVYNLRETKHNEQQLRRAAERPEQDCVPPDESADPVKERIWRMVSMLGPPVLLQGDFGLVRPLTWGANVRDPPDTVSLRSVTFVHRRDQSKRASFYAPRGQEDGDTERVREWTARAVADRLLDAESGWRLVPGGDHGHIFLEGLDESVDDRLNAVMTPRWGS